MILGILKGVFLLECIVILGMYGTGVVIDIRDYTHMKHNLMMERATAHKCQFELETIRKAARKHWK